MKKLSVITSVLVSLAVLLPACGGGGGGGTPPPNYNSLWTGDYRVFTLEQQWYDVLARYLDLTLDGSGIITAPDNSVMKYSIAADRTVSIMPNDPASTVETTYGIVSEDGAMAILSDAQLTDPNEQNDVELSLVIKKSTDMTLGKASGEYIISQAGRNAKGFYTSRVLVVMGANGKGTARILDHTQGDSGELPVSLTLSSDGTFTVDNGMPEKDSGMISPDGNVIVAMDTELNDTDGEVYFAVGVRRSTIAAPALSGAYQAHFIGYDTQLAGFKQFASRLTGAVDTLNSELDCTVLADSRGATPGSTFSVPISAVADDGNFSVEGNAWGLVSPDGGFMAVIDTMTATDGEIKLVLGLKSASGTPPAPAQAYTRYQFYKDQNGGLVAVDMTASSPTTVTVETGGVELGSITQYMGGTWNAATKEATNMHVRTVVYARNGRLYKVSALNTGSLIPLQISSEIAAAKVCDTRDSTDFADLGNSVYTYRLAGVDNTCDTDDDISKAVRLNMTMNAAPMEISSLGKEKIADIYDLSSAGVIGMLVENDTADTLEECSTDFTPANCITKKFTVKDAKDLGMDINGNRTALWIFDGTNYTVHTYDIATHALSGAVYTTTTAFGRSIQDAAAAGGSSYFLEGDGKINRLTFGETPTVTSIVTGETSPIIDAKPTTTRLVYITYSANDNGDGTWTITSALKSVFKTGGTVTTLDSISVTATSSDYKLLELRAVAGSGVFCKKQLPGQSSSAGYVLDDGTQPYAVANAEWTAMSVSSTMKAPAESDVLRIVRSDGDGSIVSFDALAYSQSATGIVLGTLPDGYYPVFYGGTIGNDLLGVSFLASSSTWDVFIVKTDSTGSLKQVTNTPTINELPADW